MEFEENEIGAGLVLFYSNRVLLVKSVHGKCNWGPPKGRPVNSESLWKCMLRETLEETGYNFHGVLSEDDAMKIVIQYYKSCEYTFFFFDLEKLILPKRVGILSTNEVSSAAWVPVDKVELSNDSVFQLITRLIFKRINTNWLRLGYKRNVHSAKHQLIKTPTLIST